MADGSEYEFDTDQAPFAFVQVGFVTERDRQRFWDVLSDFSRSIGLRHQPGGTLMNGQSMPGYFESKEMWLTPLIPNLPPGLGDPYGQARLELRSRKIPLERFQGVASDFLALVGQEFRSQIRLSRLP